MTNYSEANIGDYIDASRSDQVRIDSFFLQEFLSLDKKAIVMNGDCILDKYQKSLDQFKISREFTKEEFVLYQYNPKALSYELYGTTELWFLILRANNMYSPIEFTKNPCSVYTGDIINTLNEIINIESDVINMNSDEVINISKDFVLTNGK